jgi:hypothetical protein
VVSLIAVATVLLVCEADLLWKVQQHNVFLNTSAFFHQMMSVPGGMLSYIGAYCTQHFYYPWVGVILLCCWWLLLMWLTKRAFNIPEKWTVVTLIPVAILLLANMDMGYWIYFIKLPAYFYVATIGTTAATALLWAFRVINEKLEMSNEKCRSAHQPLIFSSVFIFLVCAAGYPLMGVYALAAAALMAVLDVRNHIGGSKHFTVPYSLFPAIVALVAIIAVPLLYYRYVYYGTNIADIYRTAIPSFTIIDSYPNYYIPYYALAVCYLLMAVTYCKKWTEPETQKAQAQKTQKVQKAGGQSFVTYILPCAVLVATAGCLWHFWYKDANFHHELRMQRCIEQADWEGVVEEGKKQDSEPTRAIVMMHNLALSRLGRQCQEMYSFPKGSKRSDTPLPVAMSNVAGRMMLYQYGAMNECHRICMEEGVEYGWNVEQLKYMARCSIFNKEPQSARKFLDILRHTTYYGDWADHAEKLLNDPQQLAKDSEMGPVSRMMHYTDHLDAVERYVERFIMTTLAEHDADDLYFQEQAVLAAMWTRNPDLFWPRFDHYVQLNGEEKMPPRIFQEAAWLFANMQGQEGLDEWVLERGVKESFTAFMLQMRKYRQTRNQNVRQLMYPLFGTTYYYEYFFLKDITYF